MYYTKTITAEDQWTTPMLLAGFFNYSVQGTFVATIKLVRSFDNGATWELVETITSPVSLVGFEPIPPYRDAKYAPPNVLYKLGVDIGGFVSGSPKARIGVI